MANVEVHFLPFVYILFQAEVSEILKDLKINEIKFYYDSKLKTYPLDSSDISQLKELCASKYFNKLTIPIRNSLNGFNISIKKIELPIKAHSSKLDKLKKLIGELDKYDIDKLKHSHNVVKYYGIGVDKFNSSLTVFLCMEWMDVKLAVRGLDIP